MVESRLINKFIEKYGLQKATHRLINSYFLLNMNYQIPDVVDLSDENKVVEWDYHAVKDNKILSFQIIELNQKIENLLKDGYEKNKIEISKILYNFIK